jgi:hypothetical protein
MNWKMIVIGWLALMGALSFLGYAFVLIDHLMK